MITEELVHCEHVYPLLLEDCFERIVAPDLSPILGILELVLFEVCP